MTRDEWMALPEGVRARVLYETFERELEGIPAPRVPFPPKFDSRVSRKGGQYCWASEMDLNSLKYWHDKNAAGAQSGDWAEKNAKNAKELSYWIAWREACPSDAWVGERSVNRLKTKVRAKIPAREPEMHAWEPKDGSAQSSAPSGSGFSDADDGAGEADEDNIPF